MHKCFLLSMRSGLYEELNRFNLLLIITLTSCAVFGNTGMAMSSQTAVIGNNANTISVIKPDNIDINTLASIDSTYTNIDIPTTLFDESNLTIESSSTSESGYGVINPFSRLSSKNYSFRGGNIEDIRDSDKVLTPENPANIQNTSLVKPDNNLQSPQNARSR